MKLTWSFLGVPIVFLSAAALAQAVNSSAGQTTAQVVDTQSNANLSKIHYVTSEWNWQQFPPDNLSTPGNLAIHLKPCPLGLDTVSKLQHYEYKVYIAGTGTPEAVPVTGGNCPPGTAGGTIMVSTTHSYKSGYSVGSASSGIQEAWNYAWTSDIPTGASSSASPYVKLVSETNYTVHATIYLRGRGGVLDGTGAFIICSTRDRCIYIGTSSAIGYHKLYGLTGGSTVNVDGAQVSTVSATNGTYAITTASKHPFVVGDTVDCEYHSQTTDAHWASLVVNVPTPTTFTVQFGKGTFSVGANTFGFCNILNTFIEDASEHVILQDVSLQQANPSAMGAFSYGITDDNDQQFIIERAANKSSLVIKNTANWPIGAFFYQRTDQGNAGIVYIHDTELTNVNCADGGGNGFVMTDSVCQGFPMYGVRYFGGYQPSTLENVYEESTGQTANPLYGSSVQASGQMGLLVQGGRGHKILGTFPLSGWTPQFAAGGGGERNYFVVPRSSTQGYGPVLFIGLAQPAAGNTNINLQWPSIALRGVGTLSWDILVTTERSSSVASAPFGTGTYLLASNVSGSCRSNGMCSYTDTLSSLTPYTVRTQQFAPVFWFWPSNLTLNNTVAFMDVVPSTPGAVASQGVTSTAIVGGECEFFNPSWVRSPILVTCDAVDSAYEASVFGTPGGTPANSKGRLNLGNSGSVPEDLITMYDSNFAKTTATAGERPLNDAGDTALGIDRAGGLSQRAAASISSYIGMAPNGGATNFLERLTSSDKVFNVPVVINGHLDQCSCGNLGGRCSMSSSTSCTFKLSAPYTKDSICIPAVQGSVPLIAACSVSGLTVTITAASPNSQKWGALIIGTQD